MRDTKYVITTCEVDLSINDRDDSGFVSLLYKSFVCVFGYVQVLVTAAAGIVFYLLSDSSNKWLVAVLIVVVLFILSVFSTLMHASWTAYCDKSLDFPSVCQLRQAMPPYSTEQYLLLLGPSPLYFKNATAAVHLEVDEMEVLIGVGRVIDIQPNGKIQVLVSKIDGHDDAWASLAANWANMVKKILVRPEVPDAAMELLV